MLQTYTTQRLETLQARLIELGVATHAQLDQAKQEQAKTLERFGVVLTKLKIIRDPDSARRMAAQIGFLAQRLDLSSIRVVSAPPFVPEFCKAHRMVPIAEAGQERMVVVSDDPLSLFTAVWLERRMGARVELAIAREADLAQLLATPPSTIVAAGQAAAPTAQPAAPAQQPAPRPGAQAASSAPAAAKPAASSAPSPPTPSPSAPIGSSSTAALEAMPGESVTATDAPLIRLVDSLLSEAVRLRASDIHIEPMAERLNVRYRIDGVLHNVSAPPKPLQGPMTSRIKIMAGLNIAEKRHPQDGRLQITVDQNPLDVRVSTLPALHGESIVMRLLNRSQSLVGVRDLGLFEGDYQRWEKLIRRPYGMILVTGPTGSGKTTTLYATLGALNTPERKLITVEDPVEYQLAGVNQVHVKPAIGLTFAAGLRSMLRQAPDVIMVGEIRDAETAQIAIQAALTGHLVFSTLHTNDAPSAVTRLIDMGIAPFLVASTVQGAMAQRLVRRICPGCRAERPVTTDEQAFCGEPRLATVWQGTGCEQCHGSGYFGRFGIYELLVLSDALRQAIVGKTHASALKRQAVAEGMRTLRDDGRQKVRDGATTMAEVLRATPGEEPAEPHVAAEAPANG